MTTENLSETQWDGVEEGGCTFYGYHKTWVLVCVWDWVGGS